jgi:hypothetical protein
MQRRIVKAAVAVVVLTGTGITAASAAPSGSGSSASTTNSGVGLPVLVENHAGQEVPVTGTVNIGNLPATQQVNGTVNVGNLPATQQVAGTVNVGNLPAVQDVQVVSQPAQQVVLQASADLSETNPPPVGLTYVKLLRADTGTGALSGRYAISSVTIGQFGGDQELPVILRAASCDNSNGYGELEDIVVPKGQTVQLNYPSPLQFPLVQSAPAAWCLYAATVQDNGQLHVTVVGTQA